VEHILRDQLEIDEPQFWSCVRDGVKPDRGMLEPPAEALPADLVHMLAETVARLQRYWTEGSQPS
jgi:hypothetical protein